MSEIKRFKPVINNKPYTPYAYCEENSEGIYVRIDDHDALKAERDALAVECAQYKSLAERFAERADDYKSGHFGYSVFDSSNEFKQHIKTPATDAYLNSVRAEGVLNILSEMLEEISATGKGASRWKLGFIDYAWAVVAEKRANYSNKLRAGEPS